MQEADDYGDASYSHGIGTEGMKAVPAQRKKPLAIIASETHPKNSIVIALGEYIGSGEFDKTGKRAKTVIRYDYFETPIEINNQNYVAAFDVEINNLHNRFRTYRIKI